MREPESLAQIRYAAQRSARECAAHGGLAVVAAMSEAAIATHSVNGQVLGVSWLWDAVSITGAVSNFGFCLSSALTHAADRREIAVLERVYGVPPPVKSNRNRVLAWLGSELHRAVTGE